jgi:hypothetical protein
VYTILDAIMAKCGGRRVVDVATRQECRHWGWRRMGSSSAGGLDTALVEVEARCGLGSVRS